MKRSATMRDSDLSPQTFRRSWNQALQALMTKSHKIINTTCVTMRRATCRTRQGAQAFGCAHPVMSRNIHRVLSNCGISGVLAESNCREPISASRASALTRQN